MLPLRLAFPAADNAASHLVKSLRPLAPRYRRKVQGAAGVRCSDCINICVAGARRFDGMAGIIEACYGLHETDGCGRQLACQSPQSAWPPRFLSLMEREIREQGITYNV